MGQTKLSLFLQQHARAPLPVVEHIASHFKERTLKKGELFLKEGMPGNEYMFLASGSIRSYTHDPNGNEITTGFFMQEQMVFEPASFFDHSISRESMEALTECKIFVITFEELNMLFHSLPEFREFGRSILVNNLVMLKQRTLSLINETAEERYARLMKTNKEIFQHAQLKHIATYLGITDTSLSRIRRDFAKKVS